MKQLKFNKWIVAFVVIILFSCSKDSEYEILGNNSGQENFVDLSMAKEIGAGISFNEVSNIKTNKGLSGSIRKKEVENIKEIKNKINKTVFYVINYVGGGYVILSADNRMQPIIAFSEEDKFIAEDSEYSDGLRSWIENSKVQITAIQNSNVKQTENEKLAWRQVRNTLSKQGMFAKAPVDVCYERTDVETKGPFLKSTWTQDNGYNDSLPYKVCSPTDHVLAGCVPLAMAQVMRFFQYPTNYNWSAMPLKESSITTSNFILDIHLAIKNVYPNALSYGCNATGVLKYSDMGLVMKNQFKYSSADWSDYNYQVLKNNLAAGRPVILEGFSDYGGHMWVCDGYQSANYYFDDCTGLSTLYFSMKWGWKDARNDGYYAYNKFNPDVYNFNTDLKMIYNIKP